MRQLVIAFFVFTLVFGGIPITAYASDCTKDAPLSRVGDWFATLGKQGMEKDRILAKRKADRVVICAKKQAEEAAEAVRKTEENLKKKLGF